MGNRPENEKDPEGEKSGLGKSFGNAARYAGVASGLSGGMMFCALALAVWHNTGNNLWLAGAAGGVLTTVGSFVSLFRMAAQDDNAASKKQQQAGKPDNKRPGDKPDFKP